MKWTHTIETAIAVEQAQAKGQWKIGDAIIKDFKEDGILKTTAQEARPPEIKNEEFEECSEKLATKGVTHNGKPYVARYLRDLFETAYNFPANDRIMAFSWDTHCEAGGPGNLKNVASALKKLGKTVTKYNVRDLVKLWREELAAERKKKAAAAKKRKAAAKAKKAEAAEKKLAATTPEAKEAATEEMQAAKMEIEAANAIIKDNDMPLPRATDYNIDVEDINALKQWAIYMSIAAHASRVRAETKKSIKAIQQIASFLTDSQREAIETAWIEIADQVNVVFAAIGRPGFTREEKLQKPKLVAHEGGKAS